MSDEPGGKPIAEMSFEEALKALEGVVEALEGGQVPLEQAIDLYERGEALREICDRRLKDAEMRVDRIIQNARGEAARTAPLDEAKAARPGAADETPF